MTVVFASNDFWPFDASFLWDVPILSGFMSGFCHAADLGIPLLIIVMYIGALNPTPTVRKLLRIRKELALLAGIVMFAHISVRWSTVSILGIVDPMQHEYMQYWGTPFALRLNFIAYFLGPIMGILLFILWITSIDFIHKKIGGRLWKKIQKWSYLLYGLLFLHSTILHTAWIINSIALNEETMVQSVMQNSLSLLFNFVLWGSYLYLRVRKAVKDSAKHQLEKNNIKHTAMHTHFT